MEFAECSFVRESLSGDVYLVVEAHPLLDPAFVQTYTWGWGECLREIPGVWVIEGKHLADVPAGSFVAFVGYQQRGNPVTADGRVLDGRQWRIVGVPVPLPYAQKRPTPDSPCRQDADPIDLWRAQQDVARWADVAEQAKQALRETKAEIEYANATATHAGLLAGVFCAPGAALCALDTTFSAELSYFGLRVAVDTSALYFPRDRFGQFLIASEIGYQQGSAELQGFFSGGFTFLPFVSSSFYLSNLDSDSQEFLARMGESVKEEKLPLYGPQLSIGVEQAHGLALRIQGGLLTGGNDWFRFSRLTIRGSIGFRY